MSELPNNHTSRNRRWRRSAGRKRQFPTQASANTLLFETFEARVLLDAVLPTNPLTTTPLANGSILASDTQPGVVQDADGTQVNVAITGNGHWQITQQNLAPALTITGTDAGSAVTITTTGGNNRFLFSGIDVETPAATLTGTGVDLQGGLTLKGAINNLLLGDLGVDASSSVSLGSGSATALSGLTLGATTLATLSLTGGGTLATGPTIISDQSGSGGSSVSVSGSGSLWQVNGGLTLGNADSGAQLSVNGRGLVVLDSLDVGAQTAGSGTVGVAGSGSRLSVTGNAVFGDQGNGFLNIQSGAVVTLGNATFGNVAGSVGQVTLTGTGTTLNVTGTLTLGGSGTAVMTIGSGTGLYVGNLNIGPRGILTSAGGFIGQYTPTVGPVLTAGLATFGAGGATNGTTADPTVTGTVSATNHLVSLRAGLGSAAPGSYTDITGTISSGAFTVTPAQLAAMNGGTLPDGRYVLNLVATDQFGIQSSTTVTINLQTAAPSITGFGLSQSSAVGGAGNITANSLVTLTGNTMPGATVSLTGPSSAQTLAGSSGVFQFANVPVAQGDNTFTVTAANGLGLTSQAKVTVTRQGTATTDVSLQWNQITLNTISNLAMQAPDATRLLAIVSLAEYDTLAAIEGTPAYMVQETVTGSVSEQAALAQTAYEVLVSLFPKLKPVYDTALANSLQGISAGAALDAGIALGKSIADTIVALRQNDGSANYAQYDGGQNVGQWAPTAPNYQTAIDPQWGSVTPFAIASADAVVQQLGGPPALSSQAWADSLNLTESLGAANSTTRTADQTEAAQFWSGGIGTPTPPGLWNVIAQTVAEAQSTSLSANVRMFAVLNTALADAGIACWDAKYTYGTWRPIQAIPVANTVNSAADSTANWTPLLPTPAFPEYVSGHSTFSAAAATVLASIFGDNTSFSLSVPNLPGVTRSFTSFTQAAQEAGISRIWGGIHFEFSNLDGQTLGKLVANQVLARFAQTQDKQPPSVIANATPAASKTNITLSGQIVDNLSGVAGATVSIDGGSATALQLDAKGNFSFTTSFRLEGNDDGSHTITIVATDLAGNVAAPFSRSFVLDTQLPVITLTSLNNADTLTSASRLTGSVSGTGTTIVALSYTVDGGVVNPIAFGADGSYDQALPTKNLSVGAHTVTLTAQDAAGNKATLTRNVSITALAAFTLSKVAPIDGATDVGVTQHPRIDFSRAVNPATLTASSFYATDSSGNVIDATIAPAQDGSYAYLLFKTQLPGLSTVTLHIVGSAIRAAADGAFLDAAGTGATTGSTQTVTFTTVSTTGVPGTVIKGIVADPGPDLTPMTFDDTGRGPDGVLNTPDDVYKLPIANAKVTVLGSNITVYTDAKGYFEIDNAPSGDVKLSVDGRTATNAPAGVFFPEMVMDLTIQPGVVNTPMGSMGTAAQMAANAGILGTFLPRVAQSVLTQVSNTQPTTVTTTQVQSPNLTGDQAQALSLTLAPGSAVDQNGNPVTSVQVGISTVPPQLVETMLPPGVTQHTFDITIQAPGVAVFTAPAQITFPNVFGAAPGTQMQVLSFDHTTGRLVIDGTATVSADGKTVVSDPGQGVTTPGWHGLVPPGTSGNGGDPNNPTPWAPPNYGQAAHDGFDFGTNLVGTIAGPLATISGGLGQVGLLNGMAVGADFAATINDFGSSNTPLSTKLADLGKLGLDIAGFFPATAVVATAARTLWGVYDLYNQVNAIKNDINQAQQAAAACSAALGGMQLVSGQALTAASPVDPLYQAAIDAIDAFANEFTFQKPIWLDMAAPVSEVQPLLTILKNNNNDPSILTPDQITTLTTDLVKMGNDAQQLLFRPSILTLAQSVADAIDAYLGEVNGMLFGPPMESGGMTGGPYHYTPPVNTPFVYAALTDQTGFVDRFTYDPKVGITRVLAPDTYFSLTIWDPQSLYIGTVAFKSAAAGAPTKIPSVGWMPDTNPTTTSGLSTLAAFVVGIDPTKFGNLVPGVADLITLRSGPAAAQSLATTTGVVASLQLPGPAEAVAVSSPTGNANNLTAYVATGGAGLAIVDVTNFSKPTVLGTLNLIGTSVDVAVDQARNLAVVASEGGGLNVVDVSAPTTPVLLGTVTFPDPVSAVLVNDDLAYVATGTSVAMVDLATFDVLTTLDLGQSGGTTLTGLALSGGTLLTMDAAHTLRAISVNGGVLTARGSIQLAAGSGKITAGGNIAYVPAANGNASGGYLTVDLSNLDALSLVEGVDGPSIAGAAIALNGSGLALGIQALQQPPPNPGVQNDLDVINASDPTKTGKFITRLNLPAAPFGLAIGNGLAFVADGTAGLQIVNYLGLDTNGVPPTVSINVNAIDVDPGTPGVQVVEGSVIQVTPTVSDDVQIRNVQLLVNGQVVATDPSYPFDFAVQVPTIANGGATMNIQALATDTGGNTTLSNLVTLNVVKDTFPPVLVNTSITENASLFYVKSVQATFNKPLDTSKLVPAGVHLVGLGPDGIYGTADDIAIPVTLTTRAFGQVVTVLLANPLPAGSFRLTIDAADIVDLSGNVATTPVVLDFSVRPASNVKAASGAPAITQEPSANPGQTIGIAVPFDPSTAHMIFNLIDSNGTTSTQDLTPYRIDAPSSTAFFQVPYAAVTGNVTVYGEDPVSHAKTNFTDGTFPLEIVPVVTGITVNSVASDGSSANVTLHGLGFIEGNNTQYAFGTTVVADTSAGSGPDVYSGSPNYVANNTVNLTLPLTAGSFGPITVTTAGGTSAALGSVLSGITDLGLSGAASVALSGTPATAGVASANPGQAVVLTGSGLSTSTGVIMSYTDSGGNLRYVLLNPSSTAADGSSATLIVPGYANGVTTLSVLGSSATQTLQIVPTLTSYNLYSTNAIQLIGSGFVEGAGSYQFAGATVTDTAANSGPDVFSSTNPYLGGVDNSGVNLTEPVHGFGPVRVTTAGGTSAALTLNAFETQRGQLSGLGFSASNPTQVWVGSTANPATLQLIDTTTGQPVSSIAITKVSNATNSTGNTSFYGSVQVVPSSFTLGFTTIPAGSLLVFYGPSNPDYVVALNPANGVVYTALQLTKNYDATAGVYDPVTGDLYLNDRSTNPNRIVAIVASGANAGQEDAAHSFTAPFNATYAGLALDPSGNGTLWYGSDQSGDIVQLSNTGTVLRHVSIGLQTPGSLSVAGLAFDASGNLLVATSQGTVLKLNVNYAPATPLPTLTAIGGTATVGTPANAALPSADAGQVITLTGSNFNPGTEVVFQIRDGAGNVSQQAVAPLSVNATGTLLQVQVPTLATTGSVQVVNVGAGNLGYNGSYNDAVYRGVTLQFTAASSTSSISFADSGLEGVNNESWGIDNVAVSQGGTTVFADNFESGSANAAWSQNTVDASLPGIFTDFLGRFSSGGDTLNLSGLTAGQTYTLKFDLYALDSWDGLATSAGPDIFNVTVDGSRKLSAALANFTGSVQTFNGSATLPLQIVPTLSSMDGVPNGDGTFNLYGSGLQAGATTVTIGGITLPDAQFANQYQNQVVNGNNAQERIVAPLVLDGPVTVTTAGGSATLAGYVFPAQPPVQFTGITASAPFGVAANAALPSANVGQTITLTGQGFSNSTWVLFAAQDASGRNGFVARTGTAGSNGTTLTVVVPDLARTGLVQVLGSAASYQLQVVPVLRSVGGAVQSGNTIEIEATGLPPGEVVVQIDGQGVGSFSIRDTVDNNIYNVSNPIGGQQLLTLTVPPSVGPGVITVQTNGGTATLQSGVAIATQPNFTPGGDVGDTLATAAAVGLPANATISAPGSIGDGANGATDVDLYAVNLAVGDHLTITLSSAFYSHIRVFQADGTELGNLSTYVSQNSSATVTLQAPATGTYYVGISGYYNTNYDPKTAASGSSSYTGSYTLNLYRLAAGDTVLSGIGATAGSGTPALAGLASANVGQTITLTGTGLLSSDQVVFTGLDDSGNLFGIVVNPATVAADGTSLTVVVPTQATTGTVRLARESVGILLQVVPVLTHVDNNINSVYNGGGETLSGSGFAEGLTTVNFGAAHLVDTARDSSGLDIYNQGRNLNFTVPNGVGGGPLSVTTPGGTSAAYALAFTGITATATTGAAANGGAASANPGQSITITGSGLDLTADVVFATVDDSGNKSQVVVHPTTAAADGTSATVVVPSNAVSGTVRVVGDLNGNGALLQIVPVVTSITVNSVASDGSSAYVTLHGSGFVDGNASSYQFGTTIVLDGSGSQGPDVYSSGTNVNLTLPLTAGSFGPITVTTAGGTSAAFSATLAISSATAASGTPANAALPSANPGQTITLSGSGLTTSTPIIFSYTPSGGGVNYQILNPATAAADGTSATLVVPNYANGLTQLELLGASNPPVLQVVPVLSSFDVSSTNTLRLFGLGLQEGGGATPITYNFSGGSVSDTTSGSGPDVYSNGPDNSAVYLPSEPVHGFGAVTVTTAGGTSAALTLNELQTGDGYLRDIAFDPSNPGRVWVADNANPAALDLLNITTGQLIASLPITKVSNATNSTGNTSFYGSTQIVPSSFKLGATTVPAGSLLVFYGPSNPDYVVALNPATGVVYASLQLPKNYDTTTGLYDPFSGHLYLIDRNINPNQLVAIDPATGAEIANSRFNLPFNAGESGLALDPANDGTLWYGSDQSTHVVHLSATGTVIANEDLSSQGVNQNEISGLVFDNNGNLLVASTQGVVYRVTV